MLSLMMMVRRGVLTAQMLCALGMCPSLVLSARVMCVSLAVFTVRLWSYRARSTIGMLLTFTGCITGGFVLRFGGRKLLCENIRPQSWIRVLPCGMLIVNLIAITVRFGWSMVQMRPMFLALESVRRTGIVSRPLILMVGAFGKGMTMPVTAMLTRGLLLCGATVMVIRFSSRFVTVSIGASGPLRKVCVRCLVTFTCVLVMSCSL